jgi:DNA repair exonuclease SbcCD nuclease subunit
MGRDFAFIHAADLHVDSPLHGLAAKDDAFSQVARGATRQAFANMVEMAIREGVDFVVLAGDLYDGTWKDQSTGQFVVAQLARLSRAQIRTFVVFGNHDAESRVARHFGQPPGVHLFNNKHCETVVLDDLGVAIHGRSYRDAATFENLAESYCPPKPGLFNLAILHTSLDGYPGHDPYAPCSLDQLRGAGHDYWALGHVHQREIRSKEPHIVFPGNIQGRHIRETGAKGVMIVRVVAGSAAEPEFRACDVVRWGSVSVDVRPQADVTEVLADVRNAFEETARAAEDRQTAVRVTVTANGPIGRRLLADEHWFEGEVKSQASIVSEEISLESVRVKVGEAADEIIPEIAELMQAADGDVVCAAAIRGAMKGLLDKLPWEIADAELAPMLKAARDGDTETLLTAARRSVSARLGGG